MEITKIAAPSVYLVSCLFVVLVRPTSSPLWFCGHDFGSVLAVSGHCLLLL